MLSVFTGTDREKARDAMHARIARVEKKVEIVRISDANSLADLQTALAGGGMFGAARAVVLSDVCANEEMRTIVLAELPHMKKSGEQFFMLEGKLDATTRKMLEKYAEISEKFDAKKERDGGDIFALANALRRGDKKGLWVEYQRALLREDAPEAIHGVLFWGAKDMFLKTSGGAQAHAGKLVAELAELPHTARRRGLELEYALESYILGVSK